MTWDFQENTDVQNGKWQVMRWEDEFTTGDGTSKMGADIKFWIILTASR